jgi:hypothetical protein
MIPGRPGAVKRAEADAAVFTTEITESTEGDSLHDFFSVVSVISVVRYAVSSELGAVEGAGAVHERQARGGGGGHAGETDGERPHLTKARGPTEALTSLM